MQTVFNQADAAANRCRMQISKVDDDPAAFPLRDFWLLGGVEGDGGVRNGTSRPARLVDQARRIPEVPGFSGRRSDAVRVSGRGHAAPSASVEVSAFARVAGE